MESHRSGFFIVLFHLLAFGTLFGDILYQKYNIFTPGSQTYAGRFKYLTHINEVLQCVYFLMSFLVDILLLLKKPTKSNNNEEITNQSDVYKLKDSLFAAVVFPTGVFVSVVFWSIYAIDRELIYPVILDTIFPKLCNHIMHTAVLIFMLLEVFLVEHKYPSDGTSLMTIFFVHISYYGWMVWQKHVLSEWPYPFLKAFTIVHHFLFLLTCLVFLFAFYYLGKYCSSLRGKLITSNEKLRKKAK